MNKGLGIGATLVGGLFGILLSYAWFGYFQGDPLQYGSWVGGHVKEDNLYRPWYLFFISILMTRHFLRIVFLDRQVDYPIKISNRRIAFWLLLVVTLVGFFLKTLLPVSASVFNGALLTYSIVFTLFGVVIAGGFDETAASIEYRKENNIPDNQTLTAKQNDELNKSRKDKRTAIGSSVFTDVIAIGICIYTPLGSPDELATVFMVGLVVFVVETNTLYAKQIKDQYRSVKAYLTS